MAKNETAKKSKTASMREGGVQDGYLGTNYQFKLLDNFAHNAVEAGLDFKLYTELADAGKFDDITLKVIENGGTEKYVFGQAKHKKNPEYLKYSTLMTNHDFKLSHYFESLQKIEEHYKNIERVLLITNHKIDDGKYKQEENGLVRLAFNKQLSLFLIQDKSDDIIFKGIGKRFKFPGKEFPIEHQMVLKILKSEFLVEELIKLLLGSKSESKICRQNRKFLFDKIFDKNKVMFRDEVLNGTDPDLHIFRLVFAHFFDVQTSKIGLEKWHNNCWGYWKGRSIENALKVIDSTGDAKTDLDKFNSQLNRFISKFQFVTNLEVLDIECSIQESMQKIYQMEDVSSQYQVLTTNVKDWYTGPSKAEPLTKEVYDGFFRKADLDLFFFYFENTLGKYIILIKLRFQKENKFLIRNSLVKNL
jgi:hypothetical protein